MCFLKRLGSIFAKNTHLAENAPPIKNMKSFGILPREKTKKMKRSTFIKSSSLAGLGATLLPKTVMANPFLEYEVLDAVGIQLFSLPKTLEGDFEGGMKMLAEMGYTEIEMFGPYTFSSQSAKERWSTITPMLGFNGSGFFGKSPQEVKALFDDLGLKVPSMHTDLDTLENHIENFAESAEILGFEYLVLPAIPDERRKTMDDYKKMADTFNTVGANAKKLGLKFAYHNHGYGLNAVDGQVPFEVLMDNTDPDLVFLEMDIFWTMAGKADPATYLKKYSGRYHCMHLKDMKTLQTFSGDGGDASQWMALFPNMASAGEGLVDFHKLLPVAKEHGVKHFFVEQDLVQNPDTALKTSFDHLSGI